MQTACRAATAQQDPAQTLHGYWPLAMPRPRAPIPTIPALPCLWAPFHTALDVLIGTRADSVIDALIAEYDEAGRSAWAF